MTGLIILGKMATFYTSLMKLQLSKYLQVNKGDKSESDKLCN